MPGEESISSPRLAALRQALADEESGAVESFWQEIAAVGAPLIEPVPGTPDQMLVTFLWRATAPVENVIVVGELVGSDYAANRLARLGDSDLWYKTYRWRSDLRTCYELAP